MHGTETLNCFKPTTAKPRNNWPTFQFHPRSVQFHLSHTAFEIITVNAPEFPDSVSDGDLRWKKKVGDAVTSDEVIGEIETDKVALPIPAPSAGVIKELLQPDGAVVQTKVPVCTIETK
ncbi:dihydrolipoyllysine-residue succinyltransferase component of 2-oxoglutarate dehydrogenase complex, mitochondrial-like isoform X2 [Photinus pyralis]|uniref:dihydrolipoyllysine-residue succinyltransferase component of 2-oxoglutarate dehydrogenase complex, mitochondrial-like isoform X2 n=1 Tax=Photinus pyralis TaxID=7054 RepID=UPI001267001F|nr:dihydrolipoyllysine-residue succinyltransferase component of 2-oxoglutarate dehydrogenase complex, mitochondrial-like isoform X2 [Photinus pyralis]